MMQQTDIAALQERAHEARVTMGQVCKRADVFRQSWHRANKRGRMDYGLFRKLETALDAIEKEKLG